MKQRRFLVLEDGSCYPGYAFGSEKDAIGEIVFNTGMTGYQETLSDPSYTGQIITFTYPLIGNYGINEDDFEGVHPGLKGMVVHELAEHPSNFRCTKTLDVALKEFDVPGIYGVDTRSITKKIRNAGVMRGTMVKNADNLDEIVASLKAYELPVDEIQMNSTKEIKKYAGEGPARCLA
ncbi:MAG: carbamoyl-phosphate synthase domain-containing protein [Trichococcus flocculiformis]